MSESPSRGSSPKRRILDHVTNFAERLIPLTTAPQDIVPAAGRRIPGGIRVAAPRGGPEGGDSGGVRVRPPVPWRGPGAGSGRIRRVRR